MLLFRHALLDVIHLPGDSDALVITFNERGMVSNGEVLWGERPLRRLGFAALGFVSRTPNWFPQAAMDEALAAAAPVLRRYTTRILFGHSMGGYGVLKYSGQLGATVVLSFSPQISIDPADVAGFDTRFADAFDPALHHGMRLRGADLGGRCFVFHDPHCPADGPHVTEILTLGGDVTPVAMPNVGHGPILSFRGSELVGRLIRLCQAGDETAVRAFAAGRRRHNPGRVPLCILRATRLHLPWAAALYRAHVGAMAPDMAAGLLGSLRLVLYERGDHAGVTAILRAAQVGHAGDARFAHALHHHLQFIGQHEEAAYWACRSVLLAPDAAAHATAGACLLRIGERVAALVHLEQALALAPANLEALVARAKLESEAGRMAAAAGFARRAAAVEPFLEEWATHMEERQEDVLF